MKKLLLIMPSALILHFLAGCFLSLFVRNPMSIEKLGVYYVLTFPLLLLFACGLYTAINLLQYPRRVCIFMSIAVLSGILLLFIDILAFFSIFSRSLILSDFYDTNLNFILITILFISVYLEVVTTFIKNKKGDVADFETDGMKASTFITSTLLFLGYIVLLIIGVCVDDTLYFIYPTIAYAIYFPALLSIIAVAQSVIKLILSPHRCNIFAILAAVSGIVLIILYILEPEFMFLGYHINEEQVIGIALVPLCILMYLDFLYDFKRVEKAKSSLV